jgi:hypothetical protein
MATLVAACSNCRRVRPLAVPLVVLVACTNDTDGGGGTTVTTELVEVANVSTSPPAKLDLLLQIDNSPAGGLEMQELLKPALPALFETIGTVDLHIGVISQDLGAWGSVSDITTGVNGCAGRGDDGLLLVGQDTNLDPFLIGDGLDLEGLRARISLGGGGCGYEQPFGAVRRALAPGANLGFRRDDAALAVVITGDEDDCSLLDSLLLSDPDSVELGIRTSFRCTQFGITCDEPIETYGNKTNCHSNEDSDLVEPIALTDELLRETADDVLVAALVSPPTPVSVSKHSPPMSTADVPGLDSNCKFDDLVPTNPAVRVAELLDGFASNGVRTNICSNDFAPQLRAIGTGIKRLLGTTCLSDANLADARGAEGLQPSCEVILTTAEGARTHLPTCTSGTEPCFTIAPDAAACGETIDHLRLTVTGAAPGGRIVASCEALVED